jgi:hypothetical protein
VRHGSHQLQRKAECHSKPHFVNGVVVDLRMAQPDIETQIVAYLPDRTDQL